MKRTHKILAAALLGSVFSCAPAYADTHAGAKFYICSTPVPGVQSVSEYAALTWTEVKGVGSLGETGTTDNILTYDTWDGDVVEKQKGMANAGDPSLEVSRKATDPGQLALRAAAKTKAFYAFKIEYNDAPAGGTPTTIYNRGVVSGPARPGGRNEDFVLEVFTLGLTQREIVVEAAASGG